MSAMTSEASGAFARASWAFLPPILQCNATLMELSLVGARSALDCARKLSTARSASEFDEVLTRHTREQFEALSETVAQLSAVVDKGSSARDEDMSATFWD